MSGHVELDCITCGGPICLPQARYDYLVRTKKSFYCSAGHEQSFMGEKITPQLVKQLRADLRDVHARLSAANRERVAYLDLVRSCPLGCGWQAHGRTTRPDSLRAALAGHMVEFHNARVAVGPLALMPGRPEEVPS